MTPNTPLEPRQLRWLQYASALPAGAPVARSGLAALLFEPLQESAAATGLFLAPAFDPHLGDKAVAWQAHAAAAGGIDLLQADYAAGGLLLRLDEGRNFLLLRVRRPDAPIDAASGRQATIDTLLNAVVKADSRWHHWTFSVPPDSPPATPVHFTNRGAPAIGAIESRHDRVDVMLLDGALALLFYKKIDQLIGFPADDAWFDTTARAAILQRTRGR